MKFRCLPAVLSLCAGLAQAADLAITGFDANGVIGWTNAFPAGVITMQTKASLAASWQSGPNYFTSNTVGSASVA